MIDTHVAQAAADAVQAAVDTFAFVPAVQPAGEPAGEINTDRVVGFLAGRIAPILLAVLGVIFIGRASRGQISQVLTSSAIAIIGLGFIAGATVLFLFGQNIIDLIFS